jgi:hypothetical protein
MDKQDKKNYDKLYRKEYYKKNKETVLRKQKEKYLYSKEEFKLKSRKQRLRRKYFPHLSVEEAYKLYNELHDRQSGLCAICGNPEVKIDPQQGKPCVLAVDHCHKTGYVRGLLCFRCNTNLGWFEAMSEKFSSYLKKAA